MRDTVVYEEIHSLGLARDIPGAELVWVNNLGHKPDWIAPDLVVAAIEKLGGMPTRPSGDGKAGGGADCRRPFGRRHLRADDAYRGAFRCVMRPRSGSVAFSSCPI